jgi:hypothetical protein
MNYNAIVEDTEKNSFTATVLGWPSCTAVGPTREEALMRLRQTLRDRLAKTEIVPLEVDVPEDHPWMKFAGMFEDDPLFDQVVEDIETYRRELDADDTVL